MRWRGLLLTMVLVGGCARHTADPLPGWPKLFLWAWERPENLNFIVAKSTGVAFLAGTLTLQGGGLSYVPRMQPLHIPPETKLLAVVRIESRGKPGVGAARVAEELLQAVHWPQVAGLQLDYDALASERGFYRELLGEVRRRLPPSMPLQMTALVSWCMRDDWLRGLPVADAVPMFFRMGADSHAASERLREPLCQASLGISTDEFYTGFARGKRVFVFHPRAWTETDYRAVLQESVKWQ